MSPFSLLILVICAFSLFFLINLSRGLSILLVFTKNQLLALLLLSIVSLFSISLISALIFFDLLPSTFFGFILLLFF
ncbi:KDM5C adjacent transcript [Chionomys nivalis]|uniref:KANTR integral membrane protein n=3 Tax=Murinae TaxID=39107 RepID=KANTR_MOUSE|nr:KDM5C adjacent transcript [Apodemus sylvaticus]XP_052026957.1 KDM5C adjacent transcript [Apodemus sylvaticus]XP_052026959.1 KDM5C adjacent transcript [Apodemus sylvaticus]XP_057616791.1 KDM5C adjacent transcript [Chionomys nivalis]XP_057616792.1 KDM5C adjacent transcript [Chionomys nivalis]A0A1W2P7I0.1 RecName: Full=KANTR integral membrane protein; Flags: Precursor [Mus musculus]